MKLVCVNLASLCSPAPRPTLFSFFERIVPAYPNDAVKPWPDKLLPFLWACTQGLRPHLFLMMFLAASIGAFEALLFAFLGRIVDWLGAVPPALLWQVHGNTLQWLGIALAASMVFTLGWALLRFNTMAGNFPMRLRWNFHRLLLGQSMAFYQDEFAGRIATKLMQTSLAVRDVWMIGADILIYVIVYFATLTGVLAGFDTWLLAPFLGWLGLYLISLRYFVPRLAKVASPTPTPTSPPSSCSRTRTARPPLRARRWASSWTPRTNRCGW
jgi:ATP-binding cassette, subfamily B, multidrug efflux pump